ncbi:CopG family transcriptional regulator [Halomicrobium urmianum]|uniref:CopG family transcriptional regulator n=1 Tax=Halomicrobium urmianum TaxID=1586233 RepID=UPI001CD982DA|nr:CopG family transcriptional regulator [Halomicrobium urmianum]
MDERIAEEAEEHGMTYSQYLRHIIREHEATPFECNDPVLCVDENGEKSQNEGAA